MPSSALHSAPAASPTDKRSKWRQLRWSGCSTRTWCATRRVAGGEAFLHPHGMAPHGDFASLLVQRWAEADAEGRKFLDEGEVMSYFVQLADGLAHLHEKRVLHRDLKPENVFVCDRSTLKIGDFGISRVLSLSVSELAQTVVGSLTYISPEIIHGESYSYKTDVWSLGVMLYRISSNKFPFDASNLAQLALRITAGSFPRSRQSTLLSYTTWWPRCYRSTRRRAPTPRPSTSRPSSSSIEPSAPSSSGSAARSRLRGGRQCRALCQGSGGGGGHGRGGVARTTVGGLARRGRPRGRARYRLTLGRLRRTWGRAASSRRRAGTQPRSSSGRGRRVASPAASTVRTSRIPLHRARRSGEQLFEQQPSPAAQQQPPLSVVTSPCLNSECSSPCLESAGGSTSSSTDAAAETSGGATSSTSPTQRWQQAARKGRRKPKRAAGLLGSSPLAAPCSSSSAAAASSSSSQPAGSGERSRSRPAAASAGRSRRSCASRRRPDRRAPRQPVAACAPCCGFPHAPGPRPPT